MSSRDDSTYFRCGPRLVDLAAFVPSAVIVTVLSLPVPLPTLARLMVLFVVGATSHFLLRRLMPALFDDVGPRARRLPRH